jgi:hypothetical protein
MPDMKGKTIRGGLARLCAQRRESSPAWGLSHGADSAFGPKDFGLVGMVTALERKIACGASPG